MQPVLQASARRWMRHMAWRPRNRPAHPAEAAALRNLAADVSDANRQVIVMSWHTECDVTPKILKAVRDWSRVECRCQWMTLLCSYSWCISCCARGCSFTASTGRQGVAAKPGSCLLTVLLLLLLRSSIRVRLLAGVRWRLLCTREARLLPEALLRKLPAPDAAGRRSRLAGPAGAHSNRLHNSCVLVYFQRPAP